MRICFVVADVRAQQATFTGIYLALAAHRRGHDVRFVSVDDLVVPRRQQHPGDDHPRPRRRLRRSRPTTPSALASDEAVVEEDTLGGFDVVFLRYNPTREGDGRPGAPLIDFGWRLRLAGTLVVNDPEGMRRAGSRMYLADFPADVRTRTLVSRSKTRLKAFLKALDGPAVLKPLAPRGGEHVFYLRRRQVSNLNQIIAAVTKDGYALAQEYLPEAEQGEKRLLLLNAEPIRVGDRVAIYRRRRPATASSGQTAAPAEDRQGRRLGARQVRLRPGRGAHLRHPAAEAAGRRADLRRRRHRRRPDPRAERLHAGRPARHRRALRRRRRRRW